MPVHVYDVLYCVFAAQIVNSRLQFRYDLGSGDHILTLPAVNVSDGMRHFVRVSRYGNGAVLRLDAGEGRFYAERWPTDEHRALKLELASGGGEVIRNFWTNQLHTRAIIDSQLLCNFSTTYLIYFLFIILFVSAFKCAVLVYKCLHGSAPAYLTDELCHVADVEARQRLRSSSSLSLTVSRTQLSTVGDRAFPVAAARIWNSLPDLVTSASSVAVFRSRLKIHLFNISYPSPL